MRAVQNHLVAGVRMNGGHDAGHDRILVVQSLRHGREAVGGAGSSRDDLVFRGQGVVVDVVDDGLQVIASGGRDDDLLRASRDVRHGLFLGAVEAGALQHDIHAQLAPRSIRRVLFGIDLDFLAVHDDGIFGRFHGVQVFTDLAAVGTLSGVILEQVSQHRGRGQVVNRDHLVALSAEHLTERQTANTAKAIDSNFHCHWNIPPLVVQTGLYYFQIRMCQDAPRIFHSG